MSKKPLLILFVWILTAFQTVMAAPKAELWPRWEANNAENQAAIDHSVWQTFLTRYLEQSSDGVNRVAYKSVSSEDKARLGGYLSMLQGVAVSGYSRAEQFAYWVNLYNAGTVKLILDHYPVDSIRDIKFGWFSFGPWSEKLFKVEGEELSLDDIEHRILRPIWKDNRIHYAVNCASIGCPNLSAQAFTSANTEALLEQGARDYVNHPRGVAIKGDTVVASKIYDWFAVDFGGSEDSLVKHLSKYAAKELQQQLDSVSKSTDWEYEYDWSLNQTP